MTEKLDSKFEKAADHLPQLIAKFKLTDDVLLYLYGRFKQATDGKCTLPKPSFFDFQARKKWDAWNSLGDLAKEDAQRQYVDKISELDPGWVVEPDETEFDSDGDDITVTATPSVTAASTSKKQSWVSVSAMAEEESIPDREKTVFDWCQEGNLAELKKIVSKGSEILKLKDQMGKILNQCTSQQVEQYIRFAEVLSTSVSCDAGLTLLHWACDRGHTAVVDFLLDSEAEANCKDSDGQTPLHYACSCGHTAIVRQLLAHRADPKIQDSQGETPIQVTQDEDVRKVMSSWNFWRGSGESF